jgi:hypothetical protein
MAIVFLVIFFFYIPECIYDTLSFRNTISMKDIIWFIAFAIYPAIILQTEGKNGTTGALYHHPFYYNTI